MKKGFSNFVLELLLGAGIIYLMNYLFAGVYVKDYGVAFVVAIILTILNKFVKPILKFLTLPLNILTFGLFGLILNGIILNICINIMAPDFVIASFGLTVVVSIFISLLYSVFGIDK